MPRGTTASAAIAQAIGRAQRQGDARTVHVWSCLLRAAPAQNWYCRDYASKMPRRQIIRFGHPRTAAAPRPFRQKPCRTRALRGLTLGIGNPGRYGAAHAPGCSKVLLIGRKSAAACPTLRIGPWRKAIVPHFHNTPGVPVIEIGAREFMCVGEVPPFDHPHVFLDMGDADEIICPVLLDAVSLRRRARSA